MAKNNSQSISHKIKIITKGDAQPVVVETPPPPPAVRSERSAPVNLHRTKMNTQSNDRGQE